MEDYYLNDNELKIAVLKKTQLDTRKLRDNIKEQKEYFTRETESIKQNQTEIPQLKTSINEMMNEQASLGYRADQMEERIHNTEDGNLEMTQVEEEKEPKINQSINENYLTVRKSSIRIMGILHRKEQEEGTESLFK